MGSQIWPHFLEENRFATCTWGGQGAKKATGGHCEAIFLEDLTLISGDQISASELRKWGRILRLIFLKEIRFATSTWGDQEAKKATGGLCEAVFLVELMLFSGAQISRSEL